MVKCLCLVMVLTWSTTSGLGPCEKLQFGQIITGESQHDSQVGSTQEVSGTKGQNRTSCETRTGNSPEVCEDAISKRRLTKFKSGTVFTLLLKLSRVVTDCYF